MDVQLLSYILHRTLKLIYSCLTWIYTCVAQKISYITVPDFIQLGFYCFAVV